jgi:hypothetical protein
MINAALNKAETAAISSTHVSLIQEQIDAWHRHVIGNIEYCKNNGTNYETDKYYLAAKLRHDNWQAILEAVQKPVNAVNPF